METNKEIKEIKSEVKETAPAQRPAVAEGFKEAVNSKFFRGTIFALIALIALASAFASGVMVGYRKANFSYQWGENYHMNFGGPRNGFVKLPPMPMMSGDDFISAHGTVGKIIGIDGNNLTVDGDRTAEKNIIVSDQTVIRSGQRTLNLPDLKVGDMTVTIGDPNAQGQIEAKLIRIFNLQ